MFNNKIKIINNIMNVDAKNYKKLIEFIESKFINSKYDYIENIKHDACVLYEKVSSIEIVEDSVIIKFFRCPQLKFIFNSFDTAYLYTFDISILKMINELIKYIAVTTFKIYNFEKHKIISKEIYTFITDENKVFNFILFNEETCQNGVFKIFDEDKKYFIYTQPCELKGFLVNYYAKKNKA